MVVFSENVFCIVIQDYLFEQGRVIGGSAPSCFSPLPVVL